jgi:site-specific DNA-methyltransferase (adenine-specific)
MFVEDVDMNDKKLRYPSDFMDKIICGDCLEVMKQMPDKSINLLVTSPPYNLKNSTGNGMKDGRGGKWSGAALINGYANHDDCMPHDEYVQWQRACLTEAMRLLSDDGAIFYNHKWRVQGGLLQNRHDIVDGFPVRQVIIWKRKGGINFNPGYFLPTYEVIYLIAKPEFRLKAKANAMGDVWEFPQERDNLHPAPYPLELAERCITATEAEVVLDPFMGSGTTAIACKKHNRRYIGIDIAPQYCELAEKRIGSTDEEWLRMNQRTNSKKVSEGNENQMVFC